MKRSIAVAVVLVATLTGCAGESVNADACDRYEYAFNDAEQTFRDVLDGDGDSYDAQLAEKTRIDLIRKAEAEAEGDVREAMAESLEYAEALAADPDNDDAGTAFYLQYNDVAESCADDGADIELRTVGEL